MIAVAEVTPAWYLVLTPQVSVSTKETFKSALTRSTKRLKMSPFLSGQGANDLEPVRLNAPRVEAQATDRTPCGDGEKATPGQTSYQSSCSDQPLHRRHDVHCH